MFLTFAFELRNGQAQTEHCTQSLWRFTDRCRRLGRAHSIEPNSAGFLYWLQICVYACLGLFKLDLYLPLCVFRVALCDRKVLGAMF